MPWQGWMKRMVVCCVSVLLFVSGNDRKENMVFPSFVPTRNKTKKTPCRSTGGRAEFAEAPIQRGDRRGLQIISRRGLDVPRPPTAESDGPRLEMKTMKSNTALLLRRTETKAELRNHEKEAVVRGLSIYYSELFGHRLERCGVDAPDNVEV